MSGDRTRRDSPMRRRLPGGRVVWLARYTRPDGTRAYWKPDWNGGKATFALKRDAQRAVDEAHDYHRRYGLATPQTLGDYFESWTERHPRAERTNATNRHRITRVLDVELEARRLRDWPLPELRRRHALALVDHMLCVQGRARNGTVNILRSLSALVEDAISDEAAELNSSRASGSGRATRVCASRRGRPGCSGSTRCIASPVRLDLPRAAAAGCRRTTTRRSCAVSLTPVCGWGEVLPLRRTDLLAVQGVFEITRTAHNGQVQAGTKTDHGEAVAGRLAPCPPTLLRLIQRAPARIDSDLLFPTPPAGCGRA
jgi:hypothetical protein